MLKLTIITICYNASKTIRPTVESIAQQSNKNFEYLIIDGASSDNTLSIIKEITPFARIISEADEGLYDAMNKGIQYARGEYICFLNAGDSLREGKTIEKVLNLIEESESKNRKPDVIFGDTMIVNNERKDLGLRRLRPPKNLVAKDFLRGMLVCHQAFIARKAIAPLYDLRYSLSSDYDWCLKILEQSQYNLQTEDILVNYLAGGLSYKYKWKSLWERFLIMKRHFGLFPTLLAHFSFLFIRKR